MKDLLEVIDSFLQDRDAIVVQFGFSIYKLSFGIEISDRRLIVSKLLRLIGARQTGSSFIREPVDVTTNALLLLTELNGENANEMLNFGMQLFLMMDRAAELNLGQYRMVMDLLCTIACSTVTDVPSRNVFLEDLMMIVQKQLASCMPATKRQGVIGAIHLIDHMVWTNEPSSSDLSNLEVTFNSVNDIPNGRGKECAAIFEMVLISSTNCAESLLLCFDELANTFAAKGNGEVTLDRKFLAWMCDTTISNFFKYFITETHPTGLPLAVDYKFCLNRPEERTITLTTMFIRLPLISLSVLLPKQPPTKPQSVRLRSFPPCSTSLGCCVSIVRVAWR